jgi:hypothetical protein
VECSLCEESFPKDSLNDSSVHQCTLNLEKKLAAARNEMKGMEEKQNKAEMEGKDVELQELESNHYIKDLVKSEERTEEEL